MGGKTYIPFSPVDQNAKPVSASITKTNDLEIPDKIKVNGDNLTTIKTTPVIIIGTTYYVPVKIFSPPVI